MAQDEKKDKKVRPTVVRDTFSFPPHEYERLEDLMQRMPALKRRTSKSEIMRAGLKMVYELTDDELAEVLDNVDRLKTGRPS